MPLTSSDNCALYCQSNGLNRFPFRRLKRRYFAGCTRKPELVDRPEEEDRSANEKG